MESSSIRKGLLTKVFEVLVLILVSGILGAVMILLGYTGWTLVTDPLDIADVVLGIVMFLFLALLVVLILNGLGVFSV